MKLFLELNSTQFNDVKSNNLILKIDVNNIAYSETNSLEVYDFSPELEVPLNSQLIIFNREDPNTTIICAWVKKVKYLVECNSYEFEIDLH